MVVLERLSLHALWIATALRILLPSAADPDLWGHLLFGRQVLGGVLPTINRLAYTAADHPWVNHEILAEAAMANVYDLVGPAGLVALKTVLGLATLAVVWVSARRRSDAAWAASLATVATALVMAPGFMIRPQLFTLLFLGLACELLARTDYEARGVAWTLPLLVALWVNTHGGVLAGVGLLGLALGGRLVELAWRRELRATTLASATILAGALVAALFANPYGPTLVRFLLHDVTPRVPITEWAPVALTDATFPACKALALTVAIWAVASRRARLPEMLLVIAAGAAALLHRRHIPLFAIVAAPLLAATLRDAASAIRERTDVTALARLVRPALVTAAVLQVLLAAAVGWRSGARVEVDPRVYPVQALRFLAQNAITGNVALPFDWGEFALWSLPPGSKVAVDGRFTTAYPAPLLEAAWRFMSGGPGWNDLLNRYPTDIVLAARAQATAQLLRDDPEWEYVYSDPVGFVFVRKTPTQALTLARFHAHELQYDGSPLQIDFPALTLAGGAGRLPPPAG